MSVLRKHALPLLAGFLTVIPVLAEENKPSRGIGIEGDVSITLERADYEAKPLDDRTPLILRINQIKPAGEGKFVYDFHYMGLEPGRYLLKDYLIHADGSSAAEVGDLGFEALSVLPKDYNGVLNDYVPRSFPWFGGYRIALAAFGALWVIGLIALAWWCRRRKVVSEIVSEAPPPTYAERMRPFVEAAAAGHLTASGQAELERLMTGYWREKLRLPDQRMAEALASLKRHPEAGELIRALEKWLHRPGGASPEEVHGLLEPYRHLPAAGQEVLA